MEIWTFTHTDTSLNSVNKTGLFIFVFIFVLLTTSARVQSKTIESEAIIVEFDGSLHKIAQEVIEIYPVLKTEIETTFGWPLNFKPKVMLTIARENFQHLTRNPLVVAYALPHQTLIVIDYSKMRTEPLMFRATLKHELTHLFLHDRIRMGNLPKWLDEGLAQWVSGGISEILMGGKGVKLAQAKLRGNLIPLRSLALSFPKEESGRLLAYAEAKSIVEYIKSHFGLSGIRAILEALKDNKDIDTAIQMGLSLSMDTLEARWQADLSKKITWIAYFGNNLVLILFSFGALLTIYGFIRLLIQKKRYREKEEEEELLRQMFEDFDQKSPDSEE